MNIKAALLILIATLLNGCFAGISRKEFYTTQQIQTLNDSIASPGGYCDISLKEMQTYSKAYAFVMFLPPLIIPASWFGGNWVSKQDPYQIKLINKGSDSAFILYAYADSVLKGETNQESTNSFLKDSSRATQIVLPAQEYRVLYSRQARTAYLKITNKNSCTKYVQLNPNSKVSFHLITN